MSNIGMALENRRSEVARVEDAGGGIYRYRMFFDVPLPGEGTFPVTFPVRFIEKPVLATGWDMWRNQTLVPNQYPIVSCGVFAWKSGQRPDNGALFFDGATVAYMVDGPADLSLTIHLAFEGLGLRNPAGQ